MNTVIAGYVLAFAISFGFLVVCVLASLLVPGRRRTALQAVHVNP